MKKHLKMYKIITLCLLVMSNSCKNKPSNEVYFTYTFYNGDNSILKQDTIKEGETVVPPIETPTKEATAQYSYEFSSWSRIDFESIHEDMDIYPLFSDTINQYTYTFLNIDGSILKQVTADYGTSIIAPSDPTYEDNEYYYTFIGWDRQFDKLESNITITAKYSKTSELEKKIFGIIYSALKNNQSITINADLTGDITLDLKTQFSIDDELLSRLLEKRPTSIDTLLKSLSMKTIIDYKNSEFLLEMTPTNSYIQAYNKVYELNLLNGYNKLINLLPSDVNEVVNVLENFLVQNIETKSLKLIENGTEASINAVVVNNFNEGTGEVKGNENTFYGKDLTCSMTFLKTGNEYCFSNGEMSLLYEKINILAIDNSSFEFNINYDDALDYFDQLLYFVEPITKTATLKDFHLSGTMNLKALASIYTASIDFDIKISINENNKIIAMIDLNIAKDSLGYIFNKDTDTKIFVDGENNLIYSNRTIYTKNILGKITSTEIELKTWSFDSFKESIMNNIYWLINISSTISDSANNTSISINYKKLLKDITSNENHTTISFILDKNAFIMRGDKDTSVSKDFVLTLNTNEDGYLSSFSFTGAISMGVSMSFAVNNAYLSEIGINQNVNALIQNALLDGTISSSNII